MGKGMRYDLRKQDDTVRALNREQRERMERSPQPGCVDPTDWCGSDPFRLEIDRCLRTYHGSDKWIMGLAIQRRRARAALTMFKPETRDLIHLGRAFNIMPRSSTEGLARRPSWTAV